MEIKNPGFKSPAFELPHAVCALSYHVVLVTQGRTSVFDDTIARGLFDYAVAVGEKYGFALERVTILPDHVHLVLEAVPNKSIDELVLALVNNTAYWMGKHYGVCLSRPRHGICRNPRTTRERLASIRLPR